MAVHYTHRIMESLDFIHHPALWKNTFQNMDMFPSSAEREGGFHWWRAAISNRPICPFILWKQIHFSKMLCSFRTLAEQARSINSEIPSYKYGFTSSLLFKEAISMTSPNQNSVYTACLSTTVTHSPLSSLIDFALLITPAETQPEIQFRSTIYHTWIHFPTVLQYAS